VPTFTRRHDADHIRLQEANMAASSVPNDGVISSFLRCLTVRGLSPRTVEAYQRDLAHFSSWLSPKAPADASLEDIRRYIAACWELKFSPATVARRISVLRELFKHLLRDGLIGHDPMARIESVHQWKRVHKAISEAEVRELLDSFGQPQSPLGLRDRAMLETLYAGAIRVDELVSAKLTDLNLGQRCLSVTGKGSKQRLVPLGFPAAYAISSYLAKGRPSLLEWKEKRGQPAEVLESPFLFVGRGTQRLVRERVWQIVKRLGRQFNLPGLSPHVLRHSAATHMLNHQADLRTIQIILGHAEISTTEIYTKCSQEHLREVLTRCHPRNNPQRAQTQLFPSFISEMIPGPRVGSFAPLISNPNPCIECASPAVEGKARCFLHLLKGREANQRRRAKVPFAPDTARVPTPGLSPASRPVGRRCAESDRLLEQEGHARARPGSRMITSGTPIEKSPAQRHRPLSIRPQLQLPVAGVRP
jgi:integrase/recombinase XerD